MLFIIAPTSISNHTKGVFEVEKDEWDYLSFMVSILDLKTKDHQPLEVHHLTSKIIEEYEYKHFAKYFANDEYLKQLRENVELSKKLKLNIAEILVLLSENKNVKMLATKFGAKILEKIVQ